MHRRTNTQLTMAGLQAKATQLHDDVIRVYFGKGAALGVRTYRREIW